MSEDYVAAASAYLSEADEADGGSGNPGQLVVNAVEACLALAATWHAWDGRPVAGTVDGKPNTWTPQKALRRITDHLIDHLHQVEALLAGWPVAAGKRRPGGMAAGPRRSRCDYCRPAIRPAAHIAALSGSSGVPPSRVGAAAGYGMDSCG